MSEMEPYKAKGVFFRPVCARKPNNGPPGTDQAFSTAAMHCHPPGDTHPPPLIPSFLLAQNLSSKRIAPTDNMRPNFDDDYSRH